MVIAGGIGAAAIAAALAAQPARPVTAQVTRDGGAVRVRVLGASDRRRQVRYTLASGGGGNRAVQSGSATLAPAAAPATLIDIRQSAAPDWTGRLTVTLDDGTSYTLELAR